MIKIIQILSLFVWHGAFRALLSWPKFSLSSFSIVSRLKNEDVCPKTVIDIGANVGQFAVASLKLFSDVYVFSIEPDSRTADQLRHNLKSERNSSVLVTAIGDYVGKVTFHVNSDSQVSSILTLGSHRVLAFPEAKVIEEVSVPISTLNDLFMARKLEKPILVKIDVQGAEDKVIKGGASFLRNVEWVVMEMSFSNLYNGEMDFQKITNLMTENGFGFVRPLNFHTSPLTNEIIEMDVLFRRFDSRR